MGWTKLYTELVTSSIWAEDDKTRLVWITLLALKDKDGFVPASIPGLANAARVSTEACESAIEKLSAPDKYSRTKDHDGRRIESVDGGWLVLNHHKYRDTYSDEPAAIRKRKQRDREKKERDKSVTRHKRSRTPVSVYVSASVSESDKGDSQGENDPRLADKDFARAWAEWKEHRRKIKKPMTAESEKRALNKLPANVDEAIAWIEHSIDQGWRGIYAPRDRIPNVPDDEVFCRIQTTAGAYPITKQQVADWQEKWPRCDVPETIRTEVVEEMKVAPLRPDYALQAIVRKITFWHDKGR